MFGLCGFWGLRGLLFADVATFWLLLVVVGSADFLVLRFLGVWWFSGFVAFVDDDLAWPVLSCDLVFPMCGFVVCCWFGLLVLVLIVDVGFCGLVRYSL